MNGGLRCAIAIDAHQAIIFREAPKALRNAGIICLRRESNMQYVLDHGFRRCMSYLKSWAFCKLL